MAMQTTVQRADARVPITVMALAGELDASNYLRLVDDVRDLYASGTRDLLLDLSRLAFMASSGLVAMYSVLRVMQGEEPPDPEFGWSAFHAMGDAVEAGATQSSVQLCGVQPAVLDVLQKTGLDKLFRIHPDRETAIAAF
jgi:anti-anti-sigma factor